MALVRTTKSVCPVCLRTVKAQLNERGGSVYMEKSCPEHGDFSVVVWHGNADFSQWREGCSELSECEGENCPGDCESGICPQHKQGSCCVLLEVTRRCNLSCRFCFAHGGEAEPGLDELRAAVDEILKRGRPLIQLSGGEPTLRDDLPELIKYIRSKGTRYVQVNTNGLRLAADEAYVKALADAGLNIVFLQFDGLRDEIYDILRGRPLLEIKKKCIENCGKYGLGVTLVPTVVRGVNDDQIGEIIRFGASMSPVVRGVHFQPVSYFGHYPGKPENSERYTLDELIAALTEQAGISQKNIAPSRCDHPGCGLHSSFVVLENGTLQPLTTRSKSCGEVTTASQNRDFIGSRWSGIKSMEACCCCEPDENEAKSLEDMDYFLERVRTYGFTVTAMAFQDAMNLDIERLQRCSLHVFDKGVCKPFCARYLTAMEA